MNSAGIRGIKGPRRAPHRGAPYERAAAQARAHRAGPHAIRREYLLRARRNHRIALAAVGTLLAALVWGVAQFFR